MPSVKFLLDHPKFKKSGWLYKQGGSYRSVKKRFCILMANELFYFSNENDEEHKGSIVLKGNVNKSNLQVEFKKKIGSVNLTNCIEVPSDKRTFLFWSDSVYLQSEWIDALNQAYLEYTGQLSSSPALSTGRETLLERDEDDFSDQTDSYNPNQDLEEEEDSINDDKFYNQNYSLMNDCMIHCSLQSTTYTIESPSSVDISKKRIMHNRMTIEQALLISKSGDTIFIQPGKHFISNTLFVNHSIQFIGSSDSPTEIILLHENESINHQPLICFNAPFLFVKNIKFILYTNIRNDNNNQNSNENTNQVIQNSNSLKGRIDLNESIMSMNNVQFLSGQTILENCSFEINNENQQLPTEYDCTWICGNDTNVHFKKCNFIGGKNGLNVSFNGNVVCEDECNFKGQWNHSILGTQQAKMELKKCSIFGNICAMHYTNLIIQNSLIYSNNITILDYSNLYFYLNSIFIPNTKFITFQQNHENEQLLTKFVQNTFKVNEKINEPCKISIFGNSLPILDDIKLDTNENDLNLVYLFQTKKNTKNMLMKQTKNTTILVASDFM
ncbi:hypothetical protein ABK040_012988 [Willaertia magna]